MRILFAFLHAIHFIYILFRKVRLFWKQISSVTPKPLRVPRGRIPKHLAVVFIVDPNIYADTVQTTLIESALKIVEWCQIIGIPKLTLYEKHDRLQKLEKDINAYRQALTLCLASRQSAKPAIACAAHSLAQAQAQAQNRKPRKANHTRTGGRFKLSVDQFDHLLENKDGLSSPDFMIVQPINSDPSITAIELHGFPPWHIRLTEIYQISKSPRARGPSSSHSPLLLDEYSFKEALDKFASAEMRFGK